MIKNKVIAILKEFEQQDYKRGGKSIAPEMYEAIANKINNELILANENCILNEVVSPSRQELIDCVRNLMGVFDTPIARLRMEGKWCDEVRLNGRDIVERLERSNFI